MKKNEIDCCRWQRIWIFLWICCRKTASRHDFVSETFNALGRLINRAVGRHSTLWAKRRTYFYRIFIAFVPAANQTKQMQANNQWRCCKASPLLLLKTTLHNHLCHLFSMSATNNCNTPEIMNSSDIFFSIHFVSSFLFISLSSLPLLTLSPPVSLFLSF